MDGDHEDWFGLELPPYAAALFAYVPSLGPAGPCKRHLALRQVQLAALWYFTTQLDLEDQLHWVRNYLALTKREDDHETES